MFWVLNLLVCKVKMLFTRQLWLVWNSERGLLSNNKTIILFTSYSASSSWINCDHPPLCMCDNMYSNKIRHTTDISWHSDNNSPRWWCVHCMIVTRTHTQPLLTYIVHVICTEQWIWWSLVRTWQITEVFTLQQCLPFMIVIPETHAVWIIVIYIYIYILTDVLYACI